MIVGKERGRVAPHYGRPGVFLLSPPVLIGVGVLAVPLVGVETALLLAGQFGKYGPYIVGAIAVLITLAIMIATRVDEVAVTIVIVFQLYVDWYVGLHLGSIILGLGLLVVYFLARSPHYPWAIPRTLWLWALFFVVALFPAIQGASNSYDATLYYPNIILGALIFYWLGLFLARDSRRVRRLFQFLAVFGMLVAIHTVIQQTTGKFLFGTARTEAFLASVSNYQLGTGLNVYRAGSFFLDPNWDGTFFAITLFMPLALLFEGSSLPGKVLYLVEIALMLWALLSTFSAGAWLGCFAGVLAFIIFVGRTRYRIVLPLFLTMVAVAMVAFFPAQLALLLQHATQPQEQSLRFGAWETAIRVIGAFPLTGVGLGTANYAQRAEPYRVPAQIVPLAHPHNSYLELAAMGGIPLLVVFMALLVFGLWLALRNWLAADAHTRTLLGGGIAGVIALSANSVTINAWTLPPLAVLGWLLLGVISSPGVRKGRPYISAMDGRPS